MPNVYAVPPLRPQLQMWPVVSTLGEPNAVASRSRNGDQSPAWLPPGAGRVNTTVSGPYSSASARNRAAARSSASVQEIRSQPGSSAVFGAVRRIGYRSRPGSCTNWGAAAPFMQKPWLGWSGSGRTDTSTSSGETTATVPQRDLHCAQ